MTKDAGVHVHHAIDYIEIAVRDVSEAKSFYATAFGWTFNDYGPDYAGIQGQRREAGGLRKDGHVRAGGPLVVLYSRTLDDTLRTVKGRRRPHREGALRLPRWPPLPLRRSQRQRTRRLVGSVTG